MRSSPPGRAQARVSGCARNTSRSKAASADQEPGRQAEQDSRRQGHRADSYLRIAALRIADCDADCGVVIGDSESIGDCGLPSVVASVLHEQRVEGRMLLISCSCCAALVLGLGHQLHTRGVLHVLLVIAIVLFSCTLFRVGRSETPENTQVGRTRRAFTNREARAADPMRWRERWDGDARRATAARRVDTPR